MELFRVPKIAARISGNLSIQDRLHLQETSKDIAKAVEPTDLIYYTQRIKKTLIIYEPDFIDDLLEESDATTVFKIHKTSNPKRTCSLILTHLSKYLDKIANSEASLEDFDSLFEKMVAEQDKAKILVNVRKYVEMDDADSDYYIQMSDRIRTIIKTFTKAKFDELRDNFNREEYSIVSLLVETMNILDQEEIVVQFFKDENKFPYDFFPSTILDAGDQLEEDALGNVITDLLEYFNNKSIIIDACFGQQLPIMLMYMETVLEKDVIQNYLVKECEKNIEVVPKVYYALLVDFVPKLLDSKNVGDNYKVLTTNFINLYFEPLVTQYLDETVINFEKESIHEITKFEKDYEKQEKLEQENIYKSILSEYSTEEAKTNKFELLTSFTKIFAKSNNNANEIKFKTKLEVITKNLKNLKNYINFELSCQIIEQAKSKAESVSIFETTEGSILDSKRINAQIEYIFIKLVTILEQHHVKPGFEKAIDILSKYDPTEFKSLESLENLNTVEPLVKFTELINIGDLIYQMLEIFYENELVKKKIIDKNEFLNNSNQAKKHFEATLDGFVANGLNTGIDKLIDEIEFLYNTLQLPNDFNPKSNDFPIAITGPTKCARTVVKLLSNHINLLNGSTEKGIIDVFQQEIGERFFQVIVKNIKKRQVSTTGAIVLICDLNLYYDFIITTLKQKNITPFFAGLKEIGQLYLISSEDSKELGRLIGDLSKFNGIFRQEEIYEFVTKRTDWLKVKKDVEKAMYGLGITDCTIM
jgi:recyclin-1